jgi:GTP-binding protein HflX
VDISHPNFEDHIASVNLILGEINALDKPTLMVFNKIDAYEAEPFDDTDLIAVRTEAHYSLEEWKSTWMSKIGKNSLFISALNKENLEDFRKRVYDTVREIHVKRFPYNRFLYPDYEAIVE